jgi:hypothetical protein
VFDEEDRSENLWAGVIPLAGKMLQVPLRDTVWTRSLGDLEITDAFLYFVMVV